MSVYDALVFVDQIAWDALDPTVDDIDAYVYRNAITGFWNDDVSGFTPYNIMATAGQIDAFASVLGANMRLGQVWQQGTGIAAREQVVSAYRTQPTEIVGVMKPIVEYDAVGSAVSSTTAERNNPNWGHVFFGQVERDFAGSFSNDFSKEFY